MNEIKRARFNDFLVRLMGLDVGPPAPFVGGEVNPVLQVEEPGAEWRWIQGQRLCTGIMDVAAVAAKKSNVRLFNPANSNAIGIVERFLIYSEAAGADVLLAGLTTAAAGFAIVPAANGITMRDTRAVFGTKPSLQLSADNDPPGLATSNVLNTRMPANTPYTYQGADIVLAPGTALDIWNGNVNVEIRVSVQWRERAIYDVELNV